MVQGPVPCPRRDPIVLPASNSLPLPETPLSARTRSRFETYAAATLPAETVLPLCEDIERRNAFEVAIRALVPPPFPDADLEDAVKVKLFDALRVQLYS